MIRTRLSRSADHTKAGLGVCASSGALCALLLSNAAADPAPGDVFVEYGVNLNSWTAVGDGVISDQFSIPGALDLTGATKAEVVVEWVNVHLGVKDMSIRMNAAPWVTIPYPGLVPAALGDQSNIYTMAVVTISVPLADFKSGANTFQFNVPSKGTNWESYTQFYGATFRIYYDPAKKAHCTGKVTAPAAGSKMGKSVSLAIQLDGAASKVQYVGNYEDFDYNGDGIYGGWAYTYRNGAIMGHIGTASAAPFSLTWNTSWIPDQPQPVRIAARIIDAGGAIYMTEAVGNLAFSRGDFSVELCKPYGVLNGFSTCTYGTGPGYSASTRSKTEYFKVKGPLARMADARMYFNCWERASAPSMLLNGVSLTNIFINGHYITNPLRPTSALMADSNRLVLVAASDGGTDLEWPGIQVMVQYNAPVHAQESIAPKASAIPFSASVDKNGIKVAITAQGTHWLRILDAAGECVTRRFGTQPCGYRFERSCFAPGLYVLDVRSGTFHARNTLALPAY